jgi:hypothetical protein
LDRFLALSAEITAFTVFELRGTGVAKSYLDKADKVLGEPLMDSLLNAYQRIAAATQSGSVQRTELLRKALFGDEKLGPVARNVIKLWYIGIWFELPSAWTEKYGALENNVSEMVSALAYTEGLLWQAAGANPSGAKAPGYGSWAAPPTVAVAPGQGSWAVPPPAAGTQSNGKTPV